jgi:hypothetical protein
MRSARYCLTNAVYGVPGDSNLWRALAGEFLDRAADARALCALG